MCCTCVLRYLCHEEIRNLELTLIVGGRSKDPLLDQVFLSLPAADYSACAEGGHSPPAVLGHNLPQRRGTTSMWTFASPARPPQLELSALGVGAPPKLHWLSCRLHPCPQSLRRFNLCLTQSAMPCRSDEEDI
jgi:hypothetical protein